MVHRVHPRPAAFRSLPRRAAIALAAVVVLGGLVALSGCGSSLRDGSDARADVDATTVSDEVMAYVVALVRRTRELPSVALGASPRAAVHLLGAARAAARLAGRGYVTPDDVAAAAPSVLRHRLVLHPDAELER
ncbi:MAG: MoxR-like ATPase, partial [Solirubrobacteraceae bacterium]|nr:MoxR-like ATPase [Solirubrobacteraceae bacterium]